MAAKTLTLRWVDSSRSEVWSVVTVVTVAAVMAVCAVVWCERALQWHLRRISLPTAMVLILVAIVVAIMPSTDTAIEQNSRTVE